jgi:hypothetical protein
LVCAGGKEKAHRGGAVSPTPAELLVVAVEVLGEAGVDHRRHVGLVHAKAKGGGGDHQVELVALEKLRTMEYDPSRQPKWRSLMMKESSKEGENGEATYVFNNVRDSTQKVAAYLREELGIGGEEPEEDDAAEVTAAARAEE